MDRRGISGLCATQFNQLDLPVTDFQSFGGCDPTTHTLSCTDDRSFRNAEPQNNILWFWVDEPPKGDVGDLRPAHLVRILRLEDGQWKRCVVLLWEFQLENHGVCLPSNELLGVSDKVFCRNQAYLVVVNIKWV